MAMRVSNLQIVGIFAAAFALGSCSYSYDLLAVVIGGQLAFIVDPSSSQEPDCIRSITVSADKGETATAKAVLGDNGQLVANGVYWWKAMEQKGCQNPFPVFYGKPLKGERMIYPEGIPGAGEASSVVEAKPLRVGIVYEVTTTSRVAGYGSGWFRIKPDLHVENWSDDPTPAVLNEQGYDVSGPYEPPPSTTR